MRAVVDRIGNSISHDNLGFLKRIRFCPSCGLERLKKHERTHDPFGKPIQGSEFWCALCGFSFNVRMSIEWGLAIKLFRDSRKVRVGKFTEAYMNPEAMAIWKEKFDRPTFTPRSTWNLGDKLKEALGL